jgi:hypothetical protein
MHRPICLLQSALMTRIKESHSGVNVWGWNLSNQGNLVHANIQIRIPVITPNHPHQGKAYKGEDFILICLNDLTVMNVRGIAKQRIKMVYPANTFHENGA